eukprot:TRINITY_DN142_c0_g1_i1.p1 TRINITY_DN142_c0_g1~~TRINITY_DN142_c0_g1_i1.p1  ORF type:complete len:526 (-),score=65.45 TRINITY_DN142_c0_g1_i1:47-1624(-)
MRFANNQNLHGSFGFGVHPQLASLHLHQQRPGSAVANHRTAINPFHTTTNIQQKPIIQQTIQQRPSMAPASVGQPTQAAKPSGQPPSARGLIQPANSGETVDWRNQKIPNYEPSKRSQTSIGVVKGFAMNTNQGLYRNYNEDRVSVVLNVGRTSEQEQKDISQQIHFFGVYDGHGGSKCADYLRDQVHSLIFKDKCFPINVKEALRLGFESAERIFLDAAVKSTKAGRPERSGSCALVALFMGDFCYVANVGDSRAVLSCSGGRVVDMSRDHKPFDEIEYKRITEAGGQVTPATFGQSAMDGSVVAGPPRVVPGNLAVSRTFGDLDAKLPQLGGNPKAVIAQPDVRSFRVTAEQDFLVLATDGVFDVLSSEEVISTVWMTVRESGAKDIHELCAAAVDNILRFAFAKNSTDNITVIILAFEGLVKKAFPVVEQVAGNKENLRAQPKLSLQIAPNADLMRTTALGRVSMPRAPSDKALVQMMGSAVQPVTPQMTMLFSSTLQASSFGNTQNRGLPQPKRSIYFRSI